MAEVPMGYVYLDYRELLRFCQSVFRSYGFSETESGEIADVILAADLNGIESHGVQRMVRYVYELSSGMVDVPASCVPGMEMVLMGHESLICAIQLALAV